MFAFLNNSVPFHLQKQLLPVDAVYTFRLKYLWCRWNNDVKISLRALANLTIFTFGKIQLFYPTRCTFDSISSRIASKSAFVIIVGEILKVSYIRICERGIIKIRRYFSSDENYDMRSAGIY